MMVGGKPERALTGQDRERPMTPAEMEAERKRLKKNRLNRFSYYSRHDKERARQKKRKKVGAIPPNLAPPLAALYYAYHQEQKRLGARIKLRREVDLPPDEALEKKLVDLKTEFRRAWKEMKAALGMRVIPKGREEWLLHLSSTPEKNDHTS